MNPRRRWAYSASVGGRRGRPAREGGMRIIGRLAGFALMLAGTGAHAATHNVQVIDFAFQPQQLTIAVGDTVVWRNTRGIHNVVADDGTFRSGPADSAPWTFSRVFAAPRAFGYSCA